MMSEEQWASLADAARSVQARLFAVYGHWPNGELFVGWGVEVSGGDATETLFTIPGSGAVEHSDTADQILADYQHGASTAGARLLWLDNRSSARDARKSTIQSDVETILDDLAADDEAGRQGRQP